MTNARSGGKDPQNHLSFWTRLEQAVARLAPEVVVEPCARPRVRVLLNRVRSENKTCRFISVRRGFSPDKPGRSESVGKVSVNFVLERKDVRQDYGFLATKKGIIEREVGFPLTWLPPHEGDDEHAEIYVAKPSRGVEEDIEWLTSKLISMHRCFKEQVKLL